MSIERENEGGQAVGQSRKGSARFWPVLVFLTACPSLVSAQVGFAPQQSPYHDVTTTQALVLLYGHWTGAATDAAVGARPGPFAGLRLETRLAGPLDLWATVGNVFSSRLVVLPSDTVDNPRINTCGCAGSGHTVRGPVNQNLFAGDLSLVLNLTGPKRWHALAPYVGAGFGIIQGPSGQTDPGGFRVGTNFVFVPTIGTKVFLGKSLGIELEARDYWLRYEWPLAYYTPTDSTNHAVAPVLPLTTSTRQITHNATFTVGLSYLFNF